MACSGCSSSSSPSPTATTPPAKRLTASPPPSTSHASTPDASTTSSSRGAASRRLSSSHGSSSHHKSPSSKHDSGGGGLTTTADIVIAAVAAALLLVVLLAACACCSRTSSRSRHDKRKPRHRVDPASRFYADTSGYQGDSTAFYDYTSEAKPQWQQTQTPGRTPPPAHTTTGIMHGRPPMVPPPPPPVPAGLEKNAFSYEELAAATGGFSDANLLGQGGFGYVHRGVLAGGKEVAVKQLKAGSGQGEREFQAEVDMISRVHHRHLVSLLGYCISGDHRLLVYDFVPNQTLELHLHGEGYPVMDWTIRMRIALGAAKGLACLHECNPRIIHRDIKSANILLDEDFEAMVADFGLAKLTTDTNTHVSTRVMGTFGYLAPEYASTGKLTEKSDVFSYGVMLLELLTGRRPADRSSYGEDCLVDWARPALARALANGDYDDLVDPRLRDDYDQTGAARVVACAAASVRHAGRRRPRMSQVVKALKGDIPLEELNDGARPGGQSAAAVGSSSSGSEYGSAGSSYTMQMERIRRAALPSPEYSAEYPGPIAEFGYPSPASSVGDTVSSGEHDNHRHRGQRQV